MAYDKEYAAEYFKANKAKISAQRKLRYEANKEKLQKYFREKKQVYRRKDQALRLFCTCRSRANRYGVEFNLDLEDIVIPTHCPYLKIEITDLPGQAPARSNASVDRVDPTKGYTKGNIEVISFLANSMKYNATVEELLLFSKAIQERHG